MAVDRSHLLRHDLRLSDGTTQCSPYLATGGFGHPQNPTDVWMDDFLGFLIHQGSDFTDQDLLADAQLLPTKGQLCRADAQAPPWASLAQQYGDAASIDQPISHDFLDAAQTFDVADQYLHDPTQMFSCPNIDPQLFDEETGDGSNEGLTSSSQGWITPIEIKAESPPFPPDMTDHAEVDSAIMAPPKRKRAVAGSADTTPSPQTPRGVHGASLSFRDWKPTKPHTRSTTAKRKHPPTTALSATPSPKRRGRRSLSSASSTTPGVERDAEKKTRNRIAATRHRIRKRELSSTLEETERTLHRANADLKEQLAVLTEVRMQMKEMLMGHFRCGFDPIDRYHTQCALSITTTTNNHTATKIKIEPTDDADMDGQSEGQDDGGMTTGKAASLAAACALEMQKAQIEGVVSAEESAESTPTMELDGLTDATPEGEDSIPTPVW